MPLRIRIGNPLDPRTLGKNLRILPDGTVATSAGVPIGDPSLPTERLEQASLVDIGGRKGLVLNSEKGFDLKAEPADPNNTHLVLHAVGDSEEQMLEKLSTSGLEIRRGNSGGLAGGKTEAVIPTYPFCQGFGAGATTFRVPDPNVIPSTFKTRPKLDYKLLNEGTYVDATFMSRLSMPEQLLIDMGQLDPLSGEWFSWDTSGDPFLAANVAHPVRMLPLEREHFRFLNHPYYAGVAAAEGATVDQLYTNMEKTCEYTLAWSDYEGGEGDPNAIELPVTEVLNLGGAPHFLMAFRCVPGGEPLIWDIDWIDNGPLISRFLGAHEEIQPYLFRDYPIWPQASVTDGVSDHDGGAYFWGYSQTLSINTKRELRLTPKGGLHDQFHQVKIPMCVSAFLEGGEGGYDTSPYTVVNWESTRYRGWFKAVPSSPINIGERPLPIFTFSGDDLTIVYSPTYKAREDRTKLFGSVGIASRWVPPFTTSGGESADNAFQYVRNLDLRVLADGRILSTGTPGASSDDTPDIHGYFREDGTSIDMGGKYPEEIPDSPMWWMAPAGGFLRCSVRDTSHYALVKFGHPYHHEAEHQPNKPVRLGAGNSNGMVMVEIITVTPLGGLFRADYAYAELTPEDYALLDAAADATAAQAVLTAGANYVTNLRDYLMVEGKSSASGLVRLAPNTFRDGASLGLIPSLVDTFELTDELTGLTYTGEEEYSGTQYGGVWHDFSWLEKRSLWEEAPAVPFTSITINTTLDVMDYDGQVIKTVAYTEGDAWPFTGPWISPPIDVGLAPVDALILSTQEPVGTTATIFRPAVTFTLFNLS